MQGIDDILLVTEVDRGPDFAGELFRRKFAQELQDVDRHVVAFYRQAPDRFVLLSYMHYWLRDDVCLVGGGCTDGRAFAHVAPADAQRIRAAGGVMLQTLRFGFRKYAPRCEAFFGYCGDARAWEVDMAAGFVPTQHPHLIVHWHRELPPARQAELIERVRGFGPF